MNNSKSKCKKTSGWHRMGPPRTATAAPALRCEEAQPRGEYGARPREFKSNVILKWNWYKLIKNTLVFFILVGISLFLNSTHSSNVLPIPHALADDESESEGSTIPIIPKPELLPGPEEEQTQTEIQAYFRDQAIPTFLNNFLGFTAGLALLALIIAGIQFVVAYGEEEGVTSAKKTATWAVIGFGLTIVSYAIVAIINTLAFPKGTNTYTSDQQEEVNYEDI